MKKKYILLTLSLLGLLASCNNTDGGNTGGNGDDGDDSETTFVNNKFEYQEESYDIEADFESSEEEDISSYTNIIDVSTITDTKYSITSGGNYLLNGTNSNLSIEVSAKGEDVTLVLNGVNITSSSDSPISVVNANSFTIHLVSKTKNYLEDSENNTLSGVVNVKKTDLNIEGKGYLYINSNGIQSDTIDSGVALKCTKNINIQDSHIIVNKSNDHAINGKTGVNFNNAKVKVVSTNSDGIHSNEGGFTSTDSIVSISSLGDCVDVVLAIESINTDYYLKTTGTFIKYNSSDDTDGTLYEDSRYILENGTYKKISADEISRYQNRYYLQNKCKGLKSETSILFDGGKFNADTTEDAFNSDGDITIKLINAQIKTLDQGISSEKVVTIGESSATSLTENFYIKIFDCYEGVQGEKCIFNDGYVYIDSQDDGINASSDTSTDLYIEFNNEATVRVDADGDGLDSNGSIYMNGGNVFVFGTTGGGDGVLDFDNKFTLTGGNLICVGNSEMAQYPTSSNQVVISGSLSTSISSNALLTLSTDTYNFSTIIDKTYNQSYVVYSSPLLTLNTTVSLNIGGNIDATYTNGVYLGKKSLENTTKLKEITLSSYAVSLGNMNGNPGGGQQPGGNGGGPRH